MKREDGRQFDEIRNVTITPGAQQYAEGSVVIETGNTKVLCAVSIEEGVPAFLKGQGRDGLLLSIRCYLAQLILVLADLALAVDERKKYKG